jgi:uncharacterized membrane protein
MVDSAQPQPRLDLVLSPHRSLTPVGFWAVMGVLIAMNFMAGTLFLVLGAWPVLGFMGLDIALVYWAFKVNFRRAREHERVRLYDEALTVERCDARGRRQTFTFKPPHWLNVSVKEQPGSVVGGLVLSSHGRHLTVGAFLPPGERTAAARTIREAIAGLRAPQSSPSTSLMP